MGTSGLLRSLVSTFVRLALVALVVGVAVAAVLPGGPLDLGGPQGQVGDIGGGGAVDEPGPPGGADTATPPPDARGPTPWGKEVLVVAVRNRADPSRDVTAPVADALAYWNENGGYGDYPAEFRLRPDAADPDVVVWYNGTIECPTHDDAIGCAPLLDRSSGVDPPVAVKVRYDPADNRRQVRNTVIHEVGHVLGVTHCEEPRWVMASACARRGEPAPDATERDLAWRSRNLTVYVDHSNVSEDELEGTREQVDRALAYFERGDALPANVTLVGVDDRFEADLTVVFEAEPTCGGSAVVCYEHRGRDVDGDGRMEYYTAGTILVEPGSDVAARGWYVGWGMAHQLSPGNVPAVFSDGTSYRERRSRWWEE